MYDMYKQGQYKALTQALSDLDIVPPVSDILKILDVCEQPELIDLLLDRLIVHVNDISTPLIHLHYPKAKAHLKRYMITVLGSSNQSKVMQFFLNEYFHHPEMRVAIRQSAFYDKTKLLMHLVRYVESVPLSKHVVTVTQDLLKTIPYEVMMMGLNVFSGSVVLDIYYAMPKKTDF